MHTDAPPALRALTTTPPLCASYRAPRRTRRPLLPALEKSSRARPKARTEDRAFSRFINPHLAKLLGTLELDKQFVHGAGRRLTDDTGREYLDCVAAYGALPFGFNPPEIWAALDAVRTSGEPSFVQPSCLAAAGELAERLVELAPGELKYATFTNSGAESVEAAIKMCRAATGREGVLTARNSFHGKTLGALAATGNSGYQEGFAPDLERFSKVPYGDTAAMRDALSTAPQHYAAVIIEPIQGEGGVVQPPEGYLTEVRALCDEFGVLLVFDEIQTGLGRTGRLFRCDAEGVAPDVMTLAKALGGGLMPIGAVLSNDRAFSEKFALKHSSTFAGGALACRAALAALDLLTRHDGALMRQVAEIGGRLKTGLLDLARRYPELIQEVRGEGLLLGIAFGVDRDTWGSGLMGVSAEQSLFAPLFASYLLNIEGVRVAPTMNGRSVVRIEPALNFTREECDELLAALDRALRVFSRGDTAQILSSVLMGCESPVLGPVEPASGRVRVKQQPGERRFAFLLHPLDELSVADFDNNLKWLPDELLEDISARLTQLVEPFHLNDARVRSATGQAIVGDFIVVPKTAAQLAEMPRDEAAKIVGDALEIAIQRGAQMVGLGAFTSVVTRGGHALSGRGVALTTGNSFTAVACAEAINHAMTRLGERLGAETSAAVVGATGAIGRAMALLMAERVGRLTLIGNPASNAEQVYKRLTGVVATLCHHLAVLRLDGREFEPGSLGAHIAQLAPGEVKDPSDMCYQILAERLIEEQHVVLTQDMLLLADSDVVVTSTSATGTVVGPEHLRHGAVVCDLSRPNNVSREVARSRRDVLVLDGGLVAAPGLPDLGSFGLERGHVFSCMAETMLLTLAGHLEDTSLGADLAPETLRMLAALADEHDFRVGRLRSFGEPLESEDFFRLRQARAQRQVRVA